MGDSLINLGDLSKPATVLVEKVSEAVGGICRPWQIKRVARAEAEAEKIKAAAQIEVTELQQRALVRMIEEEARKHLNMEQITAQAIPELKADSKPQDLESDWLAHFFDRCRLVSDKEMQSLWSRLLAGQANAPNSISKRTVDLVSTLEKADAHLFTAVCGFGWAFPTFVSLIFDVEADIYTSRGITFVGLKHLDSLGLLSFDFIGGFQMQHRPQRFHASYYGQMFALELSKAKDNDLNIGKALLTRAGLELAPLCGARPVPGFVEYVREWWTKHGSIRSMAIVESSASGHH